jgi:dTDP-glucose 4,6-dehydratase
MENPTTRRNLDPSSFWKGREVLVTGAGGFIASHLVETLVRSGAQVRAFVRYNSRGDPGLLSLLPPEVFEQLEIISGDLRDLPAMQSAMKDFPRLSPGCADRYPLLLCPPG